jgi:hypothetical protein
MAKSLEAGRPVVVFNKSRSFSVAALPLVALMRLTVQRLLYDLSPGSVDMRPDAGSSASSGTTDVRIAC